MPVAFNGYMLVVAKSANNIYPIKTVSHFDVFYFLPPRGAAIFPLQMGIYAAFVNINSFFNRDPVQPRYEFCALLFGLFIISE